MAPHSKTLRQQINVTLDTMGMNGPVTRREIAERVLHDTAIEGWAYGDEVAAKILYLQQQVANAMKEVHSAGFVARHMSRIPKSYRHVLEGLPRFICITPSGGRGAEHVMTYKATREDWEANIALKDRAVEAVQLSADQSRSIRALLKTTNTDTLEEAFGLEEIDG